MSRPLQLAVRILYALAVLAVSLVVLVVLMTYFESRDGSQVAAPSPAAAGARLTGRPASTSPQVRTAPPQGARGAGAG